MGNNKRADVFTGSNSPIGNSDCCRTVRQVIEGVLCIVRCPLPLEILGGCEGSQVDVSAILLSIGNLMVVLEFSKLKHRLGIKVSLR